LQITAEWLELQIRTYAQEFLKTQYGPEAAKRLNSFAMNALDAYEYGGLSEATDASLTIAAKRDFEAGKLTNTTKLIVRHELGHIVDEDPLDFPEFEEQIEREKKAWLNAKPKTAAEQWYKNLSVRTHVDPLKMAAVGFPRPETKVSQERLEQGIVAEVARMKKDSHWVDTNLAKRFVMANLLENPNYYTP
jgi:hypothetical protein